MNRLLCALACVGALEASAALPPSEVTTLHAHGQDPGVVLPAGADEGPSTTGPLKVTRSPAPDPDDDAPAPALAEEEGESLAGTLARTLLVLGIVIGMVYVSLNYGLRKLMGLRGIRVGGAGLVRVVERIPLDPKRSLFVVQAAGEYLLVGGGDEGLSLISRLNLEEVQRHLEQGRRALPQDGSFLTRLLSRKGHPPPADKV